MLNPHPGGSYLLGLLLFVAAQICFSSSGSVRAQDSAAPGLQETLKQGLDFYQQGDNQGAIAALNRVVKQRKDNIIAWYYLGLAYERQGKTKDARKSYEKAVVAGELTLENLFSMPYGKTLKTVEQFKPVLLLAADAANKYLGLNPGLSSEKVKEWSARSELLREQAEASYGKGQDSTGTRIYAPREVTTKARILKRPEPTYSERAREKQVEGTVVLRAVFAYDGQVRGIRVVSGLPEGLTFRAIEAARRIKFTPASVNGQPVSQYIQIEYNFNLY
jgi:TonB family protein